MPVTVGQVNNNGVIGVGTILERHVRLRSVGLAPKCHTSHTQYANTGISIVTMSETANNRRQFTVIPEGYTRIYRSIQLITVRSPQNTGTEYAAPVEAVVVN